jgi:hypothetical protein
MISMRLFSAQGEQRSFLFDEAKSWVADVLEAATSSNFDAVQVAAFPSAGFVSFAAETYLRSAALFDTHVLIEKHVPIHCLCCQKPHLRLHATVLVPLRLQGLRFSQWGTEFFQ